MYEDDRFHAQDEDIRSSRIANGDTEAENNELEHVDQIVEEPHPDLVNEELLPPRIASVSRFGRRTTRFFWDNRTFSHFS